MFFYWCEKDCSREKFLIDLCLHLLSILCLYLIFIASTTELVNEPATGKTSEDLFTIPLINVAVLSLEIKPVSMLILLSEIVTLAVGLSLLYFAIPAKIRYKVSNSSSVSTTKWSNSSFASSFGNLYAKI